MTHRPSIFWYTWLSHPLEEKGCPSANLAVNVQSNTAHAVLPETVTATFSGRRLRSAKAFCKKLTYRPSRTLSQPVNRPNGVTTEVSWLCNQIWEASVRSAVFTDSRSL